MFVLPVYWVVAAAAAGLGFGAVSGVVSARRLYFLAGGMPHTALVAVLAGLLASSFIGGSVYAWSVLFASIFSLFAWLLLRLGVDPERAAAVYVAFASSLAVILAYYVLSGVEVHQSLWAYVLGDPLLVSPADTVFIASVSLAALLAVYTIYRGVVIVALDPGFAESVGIRAWLYDLASVLLLAVVSTAMLRVAGFVLEHVLILVPGIIAARITSSASSALRASILVAVSASLAGLAAGCLLDASPSGAAGLILSLLYILVLARRSSGGAG